MCIPPPLLRICRYTFTGGRSHKLRERFGKLIANPLSLSFFVKTTN